MAKDETPKKEEIEIVETDTTEELSPTPSSPEGKMIEKALSPYISFLEAMRTTKAHIDVAPTFTPKNFYEQVQLFDDGANRRLYLYINGDWRYVTLT